jgi:dihydropteroate synthase
MFLNPIGLLSGAAAKAALADGIAVPLSNTGLAFTHVEKIDGGTGTVAGRTAAPGLATAECAPFAEARAPFAGVLLDRPRIMGIVNVTPDSFSDGGDYADPAQAAARALALAEEGADIVDVGGESTRPGAAPISVAEEIDRVMPAIEAAAGAGLVVSVDTRNAETMRAAAAGGARIVNDVTALSHDPAALDAVAASGLSVVLMHIQGTPETMQAAPRYKLASSDIRAWLGDRADACVAAGIPRERIAVDSGIGFGKTDVHNMEILDRAGMFHGIGCAVAIGVSRKSFIGRIAGIEAPGDRLPGTVAATLIALSRGVQIHRVHDVAAARQALDIWDALPRGT